MIESQFLPDTQNAPYIAPDLSFYLLEDMHKVLVKFRETLNISLEQMHEHDGQFVEYSYWIGEAIIKQEEFLETQEMLFDHKAKNIEAEMMEGKFPGMPKMTATDAKRNAPLALKEDKLKLIQIKSFLKRLKNIDATLFKAINANARSIRISEKIH